MPTTSNWYIIRIKDMVMRKHIFKLFKRFYILYDVFPFLACNCNYLQGFLLRPEPYNSVILSLQKYNLNSLIIYALKHKQLTHCSDKRYPRKHWNNVYKRLNILHGLFSWFLAYNCNSVQASISEQDPHNPVIYVLSTLLCVSVVGNIILIVK